MLIEYGGDGCPGKRNQLIQHSRVVEKISQVFKLNNIM